MPKPSSPRIKKILPLSPLQRFMLGLALRDDEGFVDPYVIQTWGRLEGQFEADSVRRIWERLTQRHAALRTAFVNQGKGEPRQVVLEQGQIQFQVLDWRDSQEDFETTFATLRTKDRLRRFDLVKPPLLRLTLVHIDACSWCFLMSNHHLIMDGWSQQIVMGEFQVLLNAELDGMLAELPPSVGPEALLKRFRTNVPEAAAAHWKATLAGWVHQALPRPLTPPSQPGSVRPSEILPPPVVQALARRGREWRVTQGALAVAAWALCLARVHGSRRVTFGLTTSGREGTDAGTQAVGMFINTLPLCLDCTPELLLEQFVQRSAAALQALTDHDTVDLVELQRLAGAGPERPLFDSLVAFENFPSAPSVMRRVQVSRLQSDERTSLAAALVVVPGPQSWRLSLQADTSLLDADLAQNLCRMFAQVLRTLVLAEPGRVGSLLDRLSCAPIARAEANWLDHASKDSLVNRFLAQARTQPTHAAVRCEGSAGFSYSELEQCSGRVARRLWVRGVRPGDQVVLCVARSADLLALMLGILRVGATYVPVDPHQPEARQRAIVSDCHPVLCISHEPLADIARVQPEALLSAGEPDTCWTDLPACADATAYIIYTSGSTGLPKGVMVSHANVLALMEASGKLFNLGPDDTWSFFHSFAFDFSVWEIWGAWLTGGTVLVVPHAISRDPEAFVGLCDRQRVSVLSQTPSAFTAFELASRESELPLRALRYVVFGGEALGVAALLRWRQHAAPDGPQLINMYGITETAVHVTFHAVRDEDLKHAAMVPLGAALPHLSLTLCDAELRAVPPQAVGEIIVGGAGVAQGYFGAPRLTAERFVPDPEAARPGQRRYRSGDLAQQDPSGALRPLGRADRQVKIRGFRIELGEIEHALLQVPGIRNAVAGTWLKGHDETEAAQLGLCAWIVSDSPDLSNEDILRRQLARFLPPYMLPERFMGLEVIPLTANGKTDLSRLPTPASTSDCSASQVAPADELTHSICHIWAQALNLERVGPDDNYFSLGGDSIRSLKVVSLARSLGVRLPIAQLYQNPTPRSLAAWLNMQNVEPTPGQGNAPNQALQAFAGLSEAERAALPVQSLDAWPATRLQLGMLFNAHFGDQSKRYIDIFTFGVTLKGTPQGFEQGLLATLQRHPVLRSCFMQTQTRMLQVVQPHCLKPFRYADLRGLPEAFQDDALQAEFEAMKSVELTFDRAELFQICLSRLADDRWNVLILMHHAILDGWSLSLVCAELFEHWERQLPPAEQSSPCWQSWVAREEDRALDNAALRQRWKQRLAALPVAELWPWPGAQSTATAATVRAHLDLEPALLSQLQIRAKTSGLPLKAWLLSGFAHVLGWSMGQPEVSIGLISSCRPVWEEGEEAVGMFLNTLPALCTTRGSWQALARQAHHAEGDWLDDRFMPLAELVRLHGRQAFQASFNFVNFRRGSKVTIRSPHLAQRSREQTEIEIAMTFSLSPQGDSLSGELTLAPRYPQQQATWMAERVREALQRMVEAPDAVAMLYDPLSPRPTPRQLDTQVNFVHLTALRRLLEQPEAIAAMDADGVPLTNAELLELVRHQVRALRTLGDLQGRPVVLALPRSIELVTAQLAALALGAWTVVLDLQAPMQRSQAILDDTPGCVLAVDLSLASPEGLECEQRVDLASQAVQDENNAEQPELETLLNRLPSPMATAYGIYTSGSTGRPKGVMVSHRALAAHMQWMNAEFGFGPKDRILFRTRPSFDASVWEFWAPLMTGAQLVVAPTEAARDPSAIAQTLTRRRITILQLVPSLLELMTDGAESASLNSLRLLFVGGEALKPDTVQRLGRQRPFELVNLYGPSETTIDATFERVAFGYPLEGLASAPIGLPVAGSQAWVVDAHLQHLPVGAPGELLMGGACVGLGYVGDPALNAERFVPDPNSGAGERAFLTRDLVRRLPDGRLVFLSRMDRQVKLGGNRVELEEIEAVLAPLSSHSRTAATLQALDGVDRLVAFIEDRGEAPATAWRTVLSERLPGYMVPSVYRRVHQWPVLPSGKTDRDGLWAASTAWEPETALSARSTLADATHSVDTEIAGGRPLALLCDFLSQLLARSVAPDDDFFALGGDSILAMQLVAKARQAGLHLMPKDVFQHRSLREMARNLTASQGPARPAEPAGSNWLALPAQAWFLRRSWANPHWWNQMVGLSFSAGVSPGALRQALQTLGIRHRALGTRIGSHQNLSEGDATPRLLELASGSPANALTDHRALREAMHALQANMNLAEGPVWGAVLLRDANGQVRQCAIAIHHMVVDGYSWRVLFEELQTLLSGQSLGAAPPSASAVAAVLREHATHLPSLAHWQAQARAAAALPTVPTWGMEGESVTYRLTLDADETRALLRRAESYWHAKPEALLCAALLVALWRLGQSQPLRIAVERHGRDLLGPLAAERSVGWFTALYPFVANPNAELPATLRQVRSIMREWDELHLDCLGAMAADPELRQLAEVDAIINFLGSFDASFGEDGLIQPLDADLGPSIDPLNPRGNGLELVGLVSKGQLRLSLACAAGRPAQSGQALIAGIGQALRDLGSAALGGHAWLCEDLPWLQISATEIDALWARLPDLTEILPATPAQEGMVFTHHRDGVGNGVYVQQLEIQVRGAVSLTDVKARFDRLAARHETLRTSFEVSASGQVLQLVHAVVETPVGWVPTLAGADAAQTWQDFVQADARRGFDLARAPLSRVSVLPGSEGLRVLWTHHHLVLDGWSLPIVLHELGIDPLVFASLPAPAPRRSFWEWLTQERDPVRQAGRQAAWRQRFQGFSETPRIVDACLAPAQAHASGKIEQRLPPQVLHAVRSFAVAHRVTLSTLVAAAWGLTLSKFLRCEDLCFGIVVSGRPATLAANNQWVGMHVNTLPLRLQCATGTPLPAWLTRLQTQVAELSQHSQDALAEVRTWANVGQLFESIVVFQNYPLTAPATGPGQLPIDQVNAHERNEYPLSLYADQRDSLDLTLRFDPHTVPGTLANQLLASVGTALEDWSSGRVRTLEQTDLFGERRQALLRADLSQDAVPSLAWVAQGILAQARLQPHHPAVIGTDGSTLRYGQLCVAADRLARQLMAQGAGPETVVAVAGGGDAATVLALLAVQFSGAAFLPLDPELPRQRLDYMLAQAQPVLVVGPKSAATLVANGRWPLWGLDDETMAILAEPADPATIELPGTPAAQNLAYLIYTSGSTGEPKGVQIGQAAFANAIASMIVRPGLGNTDRFASVTTISFDISLLEIFGSLLAGATLYPVDRATARDGRALGRLLKAEAITAMQATPATWKLLREEGFSSTSMRIWCGGEALDADLATWLRSAFAQAWNMYGPTETTIWSSVALLDSAAITVGWPIARTGMHVLDQHGDLALPGAVGELAITGGSVSRGYFNRAGLTAASFVPSAAEHGAVMYLTGDLACRLEDGRHVVLGRVDRQLKINGFRVEPGEIESAVRELTGAREVVVGKAMNSLCVWLVPAQAGQFDLKAAAGAIAARLPNYMVPKHWVTLAALPLTPNGKIDVNSLPPPTRLSAAASPSSPVIQAVTPGLARLVAALCGALLKQPDFDVEADFFSRGGHSLLAMQLRAQVEKVAQTEIPMRLLFDGRTPLGIAERVRILPGIVGDMDARALSILQQQPRPGP